MKCLTAALVLTLGALTSCGGTGVTGADAKADIRTFAWGGVINPGGKPVRGGILRIAQPDTPTAVSARQYVDTPSNLAGQVVVQIFDRLVEYLPGSLEPQPGLAKTWKVSQDAKTYTFHLRAAKFSNGMPVTSDDVRYSLDYARRPEAISANLYSVIKDIGTPDDATVVFTLSQPTLAFIYYMANAAASIVPAKVVRSMGAEAFNEKPVGSGPFLLQRWLHNQEVRLVRNPDYWRPGLPYLDEVRLSATPDDNTRAIDVQSGNVDIADYVPFSQVETINQGDAAKVIVAPGADMNVIWMNNGRKPFDEVAVRQALNYATPVDSIVEVVFRGLAPRMNTVIPKGKYWTARAKAYPYDLETARRLLQGSSVPRGFSATIAINGADQASQLIAQILQQAWAKIGVTLTIRPMDDSTLGDTFFSGKYEFALHRPGEFTTDVPVDDQFAKLVFDSADTNNLFTWYHNPATQRLARQAAVETDERERAELFARLHVESMRNPPVIPLVYTSNRAAVRDNVHDFSYPLNGVWRLDQVWVTP